MTGVETVHRPPRVTAIVVSWNTRELLARCLGSLQRWGPTSGGMEVLVVDNGSRDGSAEMVGRDFPTVRIIANAENVGFPKANNQAIEVSAGEHILLINADAFLTEHALDRMLDRIDSDPRIAAVGPRLTFEDGTFQRWTAGREINLRSALNYYLFLERLFPRSPAFGGMWIATDVREAFEPDWVCSACMLIRRAALEDVGLLTEDYPAYVEDVELCDRLRAAGWRIWYAPEAEVVHLMGQSTKLQTGAASPAAIRNFNRYFAARNGRFAGLLLRGLQVVGFGARAVAYWSAARLGRGGREMARLHWTHLKLSLELHK